VTGCCSRRQGFAEDKRGSSAGAPLFLCTFLEAHDKETQ